MGYWKNLKQSAKNLAIQALNLRAVPLTAQGDELFYIFGSSATGFSFSEGLQYVKAIEECPPLAAVLFRMGQAASNGKVWVLKDGSEDESDTPYAKNLKKLFKKPNVLQSWKQFYAQVNVYKRLFGFCPILVVLPDGFKDKAYASAMWCVPPWFTDIKLTNRYLYQEKLSDLIEWMKFRYNGKTTDLPLDNIILIKDFTPALCTPILPESRAKSLKWPIANIIASLRSNNSIIKRKGGIGILSSNGKDAIGAIPIKPDEKKEVQDSLAKQYGLHEEQSQVIITTASLNWQAMTFDAKQLMLHETIDKGTNIICDVYGWNSKLFSSGDNATLNNQSNSEKAVYQNTIIPESESDFESFNEWFQTAEKGICIDVDYSHLPILQENIKEQADADYVNNQSLQIQFNADLITMNQWLTEIGKDPIPGGDFRRSELIKASSVLAIQLGVGGIQSLVDVLSSVALKAEQKQAILVEIFGLEQSTAMRMAGEDSTPATPPPTNVPANPPQT